MSVVVLGFGGHGDEWRIASWELEDEGQSGV